ncbi:MAG: hypothetical protein ACLPTZ_15205 [Beijerinckiaceae bacterium]
MTESPASLVIKAMTETVPLEDHEAEVRAAALAGEAAGKAQGAKEGASATTQAERTRAKTIIGSEAAKGREELAQYFAFDTEMSAEQAIAALEKAPKAEAKPASRLDRAMENYQPKVEATESGGEVASRVVGLNAAVTRELKKIGKQPKQPLN